MADGDYAGPGDGFLRRRARFGRRLDRVTWIKAVLFDAGFTLIDLVTPVADVYLGAARDIGAEIDASAFAATLKRHWANLESEYRKRNPDLASSEEFERAAWRSFTGGIAEEFPY